MKDFERLELISNTLQDHFSEMRKKPQDPDWWHSSTVSRLHLFISAPKPPIESYGLDAKNILGLSEWLTSEVDRIAGASTGDYYEEMYKALLSLVFKMLKEGRPPWR